MAEFKLGRIRFVWKGDWAGSTTYYKDDVVRYGGKTFICSVGHTSNSDFYVDFDIVPSKWNLMTDGTSWKGDWSTGTQYIVNDVVKYGGNLYIATTAHTSASTAADGLELDSAKWSVYAEGFDWKGAWVASTRYKANDLVKYGGQTYVCNTGHTSAATNTLGLEDDQAKWDYFNQGVEYKGAWVGSTRYKVNDIIKYGANLYICTGAHTADVSDFTADSANWSTFVEGFEFANDWNDSASYKIGDVVKYGGNQYVAKTNNTNANPVSSGADWALFAEGFSFQNAWDHTTSYKVGQVVSNNGYTYVATADSPSTDFTITETNSGTAVFTTSDTTGMVVGQAIKFSGTTFGNVSDSSFYFIKTVEDAVTFTISEVHAGATFTPDTGTGTMTGTVAAHPTEPNYWGRLNEGFSWQGEWTDDREYEIGDAVKFGANAYVCVARHRSEGDDGSSIGAEGGGAANSRPDQDTVGSYWNQLITGSETALLTTPGDLVYYGGSGVARLPIGTEGQVLSAGAQYPEWVSLGQSDYVYYVAEHGSDQPYPVYGGTIDKPFKSIRYACMQVENGPRNPNAQHILEMNRAFIQREVVEYINYNVELNTVTTPDVSSIWYNLDYKDDRCFRDVGFVLDALIFDLGHGGNVKTRGAANSFVGGLSESETEAYPQLGAESAVSVAAYTYMWQLIEKIVNNQDPDTNYQVTNGDLSTAVIAQYKDTDAPAEAGVYTHITSLLTIVLNALEDQDDSRIPARYSPNNLIKIKTGRYRETLPIIVPENTCVIGDEVRSVNAGPSTGTTHKTDTGYSLATYEHLKSVIGNIVKGSSVTPTSGNAEAQDIAVPFADTVEETEISKLIDTMMHNIDFRVGTLELANYTDPTGYNTSYLVGYGNARHLLIENKDFVKEELNLWIAANFPNVKYSRTKCKQDVGYIVDALVYDLTYGGWKMTIDAATAYYDGIAGSLAIDSTEKAATVAAYGELKSLLSAIAGNGTITPLNDVIPQYRDTAGSAAAVAHVEAALDVIIATIQDVADRPNVTVTDIASNVITTSGNHSLSVGDKFTPRTSGNGLVADTTFWVLTTPAANTLTVSQTFGGTTMPLSDGSGLSIIADVVYNPAATNGVTSTTALITAAETLDAQQEAIVTAMSNYLADEYPNLDYNADKCKRDMRLLLEGAMYDFMFDSNYQTIKNAYAYLRSTASDVYDLGQKTATRAAYDYVRTLIADDTATYLNSDATAASRFAALFHTIDTIIYSGSTEGSRCATDIRNADYARLQLERNRAFIVAEADAYINTTYYTTASATVATTDAITVGDTSWMKRGMAIKFDGTVLSPPLTVGGDGIIAGTTYYVYDVVSSTEVQIAKTRNASGAMPLDDDTGSMTVHLAYNSALCLRDVNSVIDAIKHDIKFKGNYKVLYAARYYGNAVVGSHEEDMYYVRNGTGVRNQTLAGMDGDLLAPNEYGTSRVSGGAYVSLDPGWGPEDYRTWIIERSPYVQNVTTFGNGGIGQKIDGALHNGGNDSIVSNDFTQVISDGIGAWVANNGRAELVSVFTYYSHIGYLSTDGGRIRGTNGNNSYGDFGSVAEGFDATEIPDTAIVDNRFQFEATISEVNTDGAQEVYNFEFENAGNEYTKTEILVSGAGTGATAVADEFRNNAVHNVFLEDNVDDSADAPEALGNFGGFGYVSNANTAQGGTSTSITLAATDAEISSAYVGMVVYVDGGTGAGQYGIITSYNAGTKIASVERESTGTPGWDHVVPGTTISSPDASSTYVVQPRVQFSAPSYSSVVTAGGMPTAGDWSAQAYGFTTGVYIVSPTGGTGSGLSIQVTRNGWKYSTSVISGGTGYTRLDDLTVLGSALGGTDGTHDLTMVVTAINTATGEVLDYDQEGTGQPGVFVAARDGATNGAYSLDGTTWAASTLPSASNWTAFAHGLIDDGSTIALQSRFVAIASGGTAAAYSNDGVTWVSSALPTSAAWSDVAYLNGRFVAIASDSTTVAISLDGVVWDITGTLNNTGWNSIAAGKGRLVAVKSGSTEASYSVDGETWTDVTLPASSAWNSVKWGNGRFVAIATDSDSGAYSLDGLTWSSMSVGSPDSTTPSGLQKLTYNEGLFMATAYNAAVNGFDYVAHSPDGITWTWSGYGNGEITESSGAKAIAFGLTKERRGVYSVIGGDAGTDLHVQVYAGATAKGRAYVAENKIFKVTITEPGSGYTSAPTMTITDPSEIYAVPFRVRMGYGVLANPTFTSRGTGYVSASADLINGTGDGYADFLQGGTAFIAVRRLTDLPVAGSNVVFGHLPDQTFKLVNIFTLLGSNAGSYTCFFQVSPEMKLIDIPPDGTSITTRIKYSQVRLTGHDFLDIGTGNFTETNYPGLPLQDPIPANETKEENGGRVFYTSTDQDGNFRVGGLFAVEQSTGVATLNADAFNIAGLQELTLGEVTLGGGSASIEEFSTDPFFTADSDSVVPTQRAIKAYISSQIGGGGASLNVNSVTAGFIYIAGTQITTTTGAQISINANMNFKGSVNGYPLAWSYFLN